MPEDQDGDDTRRTLRFRGGRFEVEGVHLEGLAELPRFQRIVRALAADAWREMHHATMPSRLAHFFELRLIDRHEGSFEAVIERPRPVIETDDVGDTWQLTNQRVDELFDALTRGLRPTFSLSEESKRAIRNLGQSFDGEEALEVTTLTGTRRYGRDQRAFAKSIFTEERTPVTGALIGRVYELNTNRKSFLLVLPNGTNVPGKYQDEARWEDIRSLLNLPQARSLIRLACSYEVSASGEPLRVTDVEGVGVFSSEDNFWTDRFAELASLEPGWIESEGERIEIPALELARDILAERPDDAERPALYPTPEGGVQIEWLTGNRHVELVIHPSLVISAHSYDATTRVSDDDELRGPRQASDYLARVFNA